MTTKNLQTIFQRFRSAPTSKRQAYLRSFEEKMIYRTTKTENPETTKRQVRQVLERMR